MIKSGGEWISSLTIEDLLSRHEAVSEAAVVGVPDENWGERPVAFLVLEPDYRGKTSQGDIRKHLEEASANGKLSRWAIPDRIEFLTTIPKTSVGKIAKRELRTQFVE